MNGVHDMGGMHGFGPVIEEKNEPPFHERWEGRSFAMNLKCWWIRLTVITISMKREIRRGSRLTVRNRALSAASCRCRTDIAPAVTVNPVSRSLSSGRLGARTRPHTGQSHISQSVAPRQADAAMVRLV